MQKMERVYNEKRSLPTPQTTKVLFLPFTDNLPVLCDSF